MNGPYVYDGIALVVALASAGVLGAAELRHAIRTLETVGSDADRGSYFIWLATIAFTFPAVALSPRIAPELSITDDASWPFIAGLALFWAGFAVRWWGIRTLGRFFQFTVVRTEGQHIVDTGPYAHIRHPGYAGGLLIFLGLGVAVDNVLGLVLAVVLSLGATLYRVSVEEQFLVEQFGEDYEHFMATRKRFIPHVW